MKKLSLLLVGAVFVGVSFATPNFSTDVLTRMNVNGLTKFSTTTEFRGQDEITRGEAGKFVASFGVAQNLSVTYTACDFTDLEGYDATLLPHIKQACMFGLLKGSNGKYMPNSNLTEAQALAIVIRALEGFKDETTTPWYEAYYTRAQALGMITAESITSVNTTNITREKLGTWFYLAAHLSANEDTTMKDDTMMDDKDDTMMDDKDDMMMKTDGVYTAYTSQGVTDALAEGKKVALFFHASRCPPCIALDKAITAGMLPDNSVVFKVDYDTMTEIKVQYGVTSQDTIVVLDVNMNATTKQSGISFTELATLLQ